jgi:hypothetical protein
MVAGSSFSLALQKGNGPLTRGDAEPLTLRLLTRTCTNFGMTSPFGVSSSQLARRAVPSALRTATIPETLNTWSGRADLNCRPHPPQGCAIPSFATSRKKLWATWATIRYSVGQVALWTSTQLAPDVSYNGSDSVYSRRPVVCRSTSDSKGDPLPCLRHFVSRGSTATTNLVRTGGFEPPTPRIRNECATRLRYALTYKNLVRVRGLEPPRS